MTSELSIIPCNRPTWHQIYDCLSAVSSVEFGRIIRSRFGVGVRKRVHPNKGRVPEDRRLANALQPQHLHGGLEKVQSGQNDSTGVGHWYSIHSSSNAHSFFALHMKKLHIWDVLDLHSFQSTLVDSAPQFISEQLVS